MNTVERAFELARSGECAGIDELQRRLNREGYSLAASHLSAPTLRKQLIALIKEAAAPLAAE
jgi:hypothetical protein